jgi:hypothetical protein
LATVVLLGLLVGLDNLQVGAALGLVRMRAGRRRHQRTGLAIVCPITNTKRDIPFHVALPQESTVTGFVMVEQVKAIDFRGALPPPLTDFPRTTRISGLGRPSRDRRQRPADPGVRLCSKKGDRS